LSGKALNVVYFGFPKSKVPQVELCLRLAGMLEEAKTSVGPVKNSINTSYEHKTDSPNRATDQTKKYSICITHYNNVETVRASLDSILSQIDENFEVVVVDNFSKDGSFGVLTEYSRAGKIKLIRAKSSRGKGREISFENSQGDYIISNLDMDETYLDSLKEILHFYHARCEGKLLLVISGMEKDIRGLQNITIVPRSLVIELGGWRNLQYAEDWDLWARAAKIGAYSFTVFNLLRSPNQHQEREQPIQKLKLRYIRYRELLRLDRRSFFDDTGMNIQQLGIYLLAKASYRFHECYHDKFNINFDPYVKDYYIPYEHGDSPSRHDNLQKG
jgi:glycosyltransferase involved in cell wall biosynthesis